VFHLLTPIGPRVPDSVSVFFFGRHISLDIPAFSPLVKFILIL